LIFTNVNTNLLVLKLKIKKLGYKNLIKNIKEFREVFEVHYNLQ